MSPLVPEVGRSRWTIPLSVVLVCVSLAIGWLNWNNVGAATSLIHLRIFLFGWTATAVVFALTLSGLLSRPARSETRWVVVGNVLLTGLVTGLAVGTTDWGAFTLGSWWQLWLTVPLVAGQVLVILRRLPAAHREPAAHQ